MVWKVVIFHDTMAQTQFFKWKYVFPNAVRLIFRYIGNNLKIIFHSFGQEMRKPPGLFILSVPHR